MVFDERRPSFELAPFQSALDVVLRLRNRSSFSAEELQSCLDNLRELGDLTPLTGDAPQPARDLCEC